MDHHQIHAAVEIADKFVGGIATGGGWAKVIAASEAFRKYSWIKDAPVRNSVGNFQGMVLNSKWAIRFQWAKDALEPVENVALFASLAANMDRAKNETRRILASNEPPAIKAARFSAQVSSVALRTASAAIFSYVDLSAFAISGYLQMADLAGLRSAADWNKSIQKLNALIHSSFDKVTDGANIYLVVNQHFTF